MKAFRALCMSRNYPNEVLPRLGIWAQSMVTACEGWCETKVIAPVPYFPNVPLLSRYSRYSRIPDREWREGIDVYHPRFVVAPGMTLHRFEGRSYYYGVRRKVEELRKTFKFDVINAYFVYPDGVVAARLGAELGVPVIISEQSSWNPWLNEHPSVRDQALDAVRSARKLIAVSTSLARSIQSFGVPADKIAVVPNVVNGAVFSPEGRPQSIPTARILFVGIIRAVKGLDVLLRAFRILLDKGTDAELAVVGESFYPSYARDLAQLHTLADNLGLGDKVKFLGGMDPARVAEQMRQSSVLVVASRRETFGSVLAEALACGTPVVATRCGGPEDIVEPGLGVLVEPENPSALAAGIEEVLSARSSYDPQRLSARALERFGTEAVSMQMREVYETALGRSA